MADKNSIKNWFKTGLKPTQAQFWATWDSFWHKDEKIPITAIEEIEDILGAKAEAEVLTHHLDDENAHADEFADKLDKGGYTGNAKNLSDRIDAIKYPNALLSSVPPTRVGNTMTFPAGMYIARINQNNVLNLAYSATIIAAADNYHRTDVIELREDGTLNKIVGDPSLTAAFKPNLSDNAVEVTTIDVFGSVISNPSTPYDSSSLLPRGGYNGTAQDLANGMVDLNAANLKFGGYPSTRNDGQIPTNRVLGTDVNGFLKMYTIATAPAPYLDELIPDSHMPSTTGNFILKGSFFTPTMNVVIEGQTINYLTFISDNEFHVNVTTGATEGYFNVTLDNGISRTFSNALLIVLGTVFSPVESDWTSVGGLADTTGGDSFKVYNYGVQGVKTINWNINTNLSKGFQFLFSTVPSPLGRWDNNEDQEWIKFTDTVTGDTWKWGIYIGTSSELHYRKNSGGSVALCWQPELFNTYTIYYDKTALYVKRQGVGYSLCDTIVLNNPIKVEFSVRLHDIVNIKYVELAT